jgi:pyrroline-5-carboxylate reductase
MTELVIVGGGKMGEALLGGLLAAGWADAADITVVEPVAERRDELAGRFPGLVTSAEPVAAAGAVIAVKPQMVAEVCGVLGALGVPRIVSIAAGIRLATMEAEVPAGTAIVRAMPNTPAVVGRGAAAIAGGASADDDDLAWAEGILGAVGIVVRVTEPELDLVTGLSGSGPAYVFLVAEALIDAGVAAGLDREIATELGTQTLLGAAELLATGQPAAELRANVTSPNGTTFEGVKVLEESGIREMFTAAVRAAVERSREMG